MSTVPPIIRWDQAYNRNGDADLPRAVVNAIRTHMNNHTLEGYVKAETLAHYTGLKIRAVRAQIAANVKAGWIEIVRSGNSSGLANTYRLTYPKGVVQNTIPGEKGVVDDTVRVSSNAKKGVVDDTPTTPTTTPENFSIEKFEGTTPKKGVADDTVPSDPFGSGDIVPVDLDRRSTDRRSTTESNGVVDDTLAATGDTVAALDDPFAPWGPADSADSGDPRDPFSSAFIPPNLRELAR